MSENMDAIVLLLVVASRIIVPLFVFRYPLPAIIAALVIDAADKSILESFTNLNLDLYQSYDKALDIYYLALAYVATMRNWSNLDTFNVSRFLWYFRLVGATLFELTGIRALLLLFPNVFEYFFIYIEAAKTRWSPVRFSTQHVLVAAAVIWIFIKLPQEYWIHIAQRDTTDFIKESILGASLDDSWSQAIQDNLWVVPVLLGAAALLYFGIRWVLNTLPEPDWHTSFDADVVADEYLSAPVSPKSERHWREGLFEKFALVGLVAIIFASMLPNINASPFQMALGVGLVIVGNALISHWLAVRGFGWQSFAAEFGALAAINFVLALAYVLILPSFDGEARLRDVLFFSLLLTLLVSLYDRYRPIYDARVTASVQAKNEESARGAS